MPTNDIKPFASAGGANVLTQAEYLALAALSTGFSSGKASSKEVNKAIRQATFIASVLAQFICDKSGSDVLDDGNVTGLVTKLISAMNKTSQPLDATLTALAGLVGAANKLPYFNGTDTAALTDLSAFARTLLDDTDAAMARSTLGAQAADATLATIAALTGAANKMLYFSGADVASLTDLTAFARTLLSRTDASSILSDLGLDRIVQNTDETIIKAPGGLLYLFINKNNKWGCHSTGGGGIALGIEYGGTGGANKTDALANLGLSDVVHLSDYTSGSNWRRTPDGYIEQWGTSPSAVAGVASITFPIPFPNSCQSIQLTEITSASAGVAGVLSWGLSTDTITKTGFSALANKSTTESMNWRAIGK
ncbi:TPA: hypothetical protein ACGRST_001575 [Escherichia coli]